MGRGVRRCRDVVVYPLLFSSIYMVLFVGLRWVNVYQYRVMNLCYGCNI